MTENDNNNTTTTTKNNDGDSRNHGNNQNDRKKASWQHAPRRNPRDTANSAKNDVGAKAERSFLTML